MAMKFNKPSDEQILQVLSTMPRTTTRMVTRAVQDDCNTIVSEGWVRGRLKKLQEQGVVAGRYAEPGGGRYFTWWVNQEIPK